jgi:hypothetical protein
MPENKTVKNRVLCLAMCVLTLFCFYSVCPAGEKKSEEEMSDSERLSRALQKGLKNGELSPKAKTGSDTEGPRYTPDKADKIINALIAKNLTDTQIMIRAMQMAEDREEVFTLLKRLSDMGNCKAMGRLGVNMIHTLENDPHHNLYEGFRLLVTAARAGDARAQWSLGVATSLDPQFNTTYKTQLREAYRWYYASAEQGYARAQLDIGQMLERGIAPNSTGRGNPDQENYIEAYKWLTLAINRFTAGPVKKGSILAEYVGFAQSSLNYMVKKNYINKEQIREALKRARAWEKSHPHAYQIYPTNGLDAWQ